MVVMTIVFSALGHGRHGGSRKGRDGLLVILFLFFLLGRRRRLLN